MPSLPRSILNTALRLIADARAIDQAVNEARAARDDHRLGELIDPRDTASIAEWGAANLGNEERPTA